VDAEGRLAQAPWRLNWEVVADAAVGIPGAADLRRREDHRDRARGQDGGDERAGVEDPESGVDDVRGGDKQLLSQGLEAVSREVLSEVGGRLRGVEQAGRPH